jgi:hypothetical protein
VGGGLYKKLHEHTAPGETSMAHLAMTGGCTVLRTLYSSGRKLAVFEVCANTASVVVTTHGHSREKRAAPEDQSPLEIQGADLGIAALSF